jgi:hypothetical protein
MYSPIGGDDLGDPWYWVILKNGTARIRETKPKGPYVEEYVVEVGFQHKWHFLTTDKGYKCDYQSRCGYDRGPRFNNVIRKMLRR